MVKFLQPSSDVAVNPLTNEKLSSSDVINIAPNVRTPIIKFRVPDRVSWILEDDPALVLELYDSNGNKLPDSAYVVISAKSPGEIADQPIGEKDIRVYNSLTTVEQESTEYESAVRFPTKGEVSFIPKDELIVSILSNAATSVDWSKSYIKIKVEEKSF